MPAPFFKSNQKVRLGWVKSPLDNLLHQASLDLEAFTFSQKTENLTLLRHAVNHLQQIAGVLEILELSGAKLLTTEIEALGQSILAQKVRDDLSALDVLVRGMVWLQNYLTQLAAGKKDYPLQVLAVANELRAARGEALQTPIELFEPDLTRPLPATLNIGTKTGDRELCSRATRLRIHYEAALLQWFRDPSGEGLSRLAQVLANLRRLSHRSATLRLWWFAQGITEALQEGGLQPSQDIKLLLGKLDKPIKVLAQEGESVLAANIPDTLLKALLLQVANATSTGTEVTTIKASYHLDYYLSADRASLNHLGIDVIEAVLVCLSEELDDAKDLCDVLERPSLQSQQHLTTLWHLLHKLADTLEVLGFTESLTILQQTRGRLEPQIQRETAFNEEQRRELACTLLQLETALGKERRLSVCGSEKGPSPPASADTLARLPSPLASRDSIETVQQRAVSECLAELAVVAHALDAFIRTPTNLQELVSLAPNIQQTAAVLSILGLNAAAALLIKCHRCICEGLPEKTSASSPLEALAIALAALKTYLEMWVTEMPVSDSLLDTATVRLAPFLELLEPPATDAYPPLTAEETSTLANPSAHPDPRHEVTATFLEEAAEILQTSQTLLLAWPQNPSSEAPVAEFQRKLHTLKGGAHLVGLTPLAELVHHMETMLSANVHYNSPPDPVRLELLQRCLDRLWTLHDQAREGNPLPSVTDLLHEIKHYHAGAHAVEPAPGILPQDPPQSAREEALSMASAFSPPAPESPLPAENQSLHVEQVRVRADLLDHLFNHAVALNQSCTGLGYQVETLHANLGEMDPLLTRLSEQLHRPEHETTIPRLDCSAQMAPERRHNPRLLEVAFPPPKFDDLKDSLRHLTRSQQKLKETMQAVDTLLRQQSHLNAQLQQDLKNTQRLPFAGIAPRLQRVVRHTAQTLNRQARLKINGGEIELKRTLLNRITAPLEHMLRNSVSHGIEPPSERSAADKEEIGTIQLSLAQEDRELVIRLSDDGRGIDLEKIRATALAQGLLPTEAAPTDDCLMRLILAPGFSTVKDSSPLAGRGIGLDIAANEIHQLHGRLEIASSQGKGATFTIHLPYC